MSSTDVVSVGLQASSLETAPKFDSYSKVIIRTGSFDDNKNELVFIAGTDTGRTLEIENEWGSQAMAENILNSIKGWRYQPYEAKGVMLDPAAEMGDAIKVGNIYSGIYTRSITFDNLMMAGVSAPSDEETIHEYGYTPSTERKYYRQIADARAEISIRATEIRSEVSGKADKASEGSGFGYILTDKEANFYTKDSGGNHTKLVINKDGATVTGTIQATNGYIGNDRSGFTITATAMYNKIASMGDDTQESGVYIGTDGIKLGNSFKVTSSGRITATDGEFSGTLKCRYLYTWNSSKNDYDLFSGNIATALGGGSGYAGRQSTYEKIADSTTSGGATFLPILRVTKITATAAVITSLTMQNDRGALVTCSKYDDIWRDIRGRAKLDWANIENKPTIPATPTISSLGLKSHSLTVVTSVNFATQSVTTRTINYYNNKSIL